MTPNKLEALKAHLKAQSWEWKSGKPIAHGEQIIVSDGSHSANVSYYPKSQSLVVGGAASPLRELLKSWVESQKHPVVTTNGYSYTVPSQIPATLPLEGRQLLSTIAGAHIGMDEAGKGDWFGPLVVAGVYAVPEMQHQLRALGVRDSKLLKPKQIHDIALRITQLLPKEHYEILIIDPPSYNQLYSKCNNINILLAECYAQLAVAIQRTTNCSAFVCDQFSQNSDRLKSAFASQNISPPAQSHQAESMSVAVAAASILASDAFAQALQSLGIAAGFTSPLPRGSSQVLNLEAAATQILAQGGEAALAQYAKMHFRPIQNLLKGKKDMNKSFQSNREYIELQGPYPPTIQSIRQYEKYWHFMLVDGCVVEWTKDARGAISVKGNTKSSTYRVLKDKTDGKFVDASLHKDAEVRLKWLTKRINELALQSMAEMKTSPGVGWTYSKPLIGSRFEFTDGAILIYHHNGTLQMQGILTPTTRATLEQLPNPFPFSIEILQERLKQYFPDWQLGSGSRDGEAETSESEEVPLLGINWAPFKPANYTMRKAASFPGQNPCQQELIEDWAVTLSPEAGKKHLLAHAPTGLGKTISSLMPALAWIAMDPDNRRLYYLVNRVNQHDNPISELKQTLAPLFQENTDQPLRVVDLVGRKYLCHHSQSSALQPSCKKARIEATFERLPSPVASWRDVKSHLGQRVCPYHTLQGLMANAHVVICDYWWFFSPEAQQNSEIKRISGIEAGECILIVDEAHNLPLRVKKDLMVDATSEALVGAISSAPVQVRDQLEEVLSALEQMKVGSQAKVVQRLGGSRAIRQLLKELTEDTAEDTVSSPYVKLLRMLLYPEDVAFIDWLENQDGTRRLYARLLNPAAILQAGFQQAYASLSMSGTLAAPSDPTDELRYQVLLFGLPLAKTWSKKYASPFPAKNARWIFCPDTRGTENERKKYFDKYAEHIVNIGKKTLGVTAVFFSSYEFLEAVRARVADRLSTDCIFDERVLNLRREDADGNDLEFCKNELQKKVAEHGIAFLFAAYSGKIAEGANFENNLIKTVICVSLPIEYTKSYHERLKQLYRDQFKEIAEGRNDQVLEKADEYAIQRVSLSLVLQACGRGIRREADRCAFVLLDERYGEKDSRWRKFFDPRPYNLSEPERIVETFHRDKKIEPDAMWDAKLLRHQKER